MLLAMSFINLIFRVRFIFCIYIRFMLFLCFFLQKTFLVPNLFILVNLLVLLSESFLLVIDFISNWLVYVRLVASLLHLCFYRFDMQIVNQTFCQVILTTRNSTIWKLAIFHGDSSHLFPNSKFWLQSRV